MKISLNGVWNVEDSLSEFKFEGKVPGSVQADLIERNLLPHPYVGKNELKFRNLEERNWTYEREFTIDRIDEKMKYELVFEGIDTVARIFLNGIFVGETMNMFMEYRFDVKDKLKVGSNILRVEMVSPVRYAKILENNFGRLKLHSNTFRVYIRKAQYSFGWDWGPRIPVVGIWKDVYIDVHEDGELFGSTAYILDEDGPIHLTGYVRGIADDLEKYVVEVRIDGEEKLMIPLKMEGNRHRFDGILDEKLELWYPRDLGEPVLHEFEFNLLKEGKLIHSEKKKIGLRTVRVVREDDGEGESFIFEVNGEKIFTKGANWIPADSILSWLRDEDYENLVRMAHDANMNMLRVWGGGIYESDVFYNMCDELGIMVWQDFMFACAEYPDHLEWFRKLVNEEAEQIVIKLRHHPSIVLWCGNNENNWGFDEWGFDTKVDGINLGNRLYLNDFPKICSREDPSTPYWPSSPYGGKKANSESAGDLHVWHVWSGWVDFREYTNVRGKFVSEFGFQSAPSMETIRFFAKEEDMYPFSEVMLHHNKQVDGMERIMKFINSEFGLVVDFESIVYLSQLIQAEAIKTGVEHWRSRKYRTAGTLYWQFNDSWPVFSWSSVDYFKRPKALYYYTKRFYAPLLPLAIRKDEVEIYVVNDLKKPIEGELTVEFWDVEGNMIDKRKIDAHIPADSSMKVMNVDGNGDFLHLILKCDGKMIENHLILRKFREIELRDPKISWKVEGKKIILKSEKPAFGVQIEGCKPSENYLVVFPGYMVEVDFEGDPSKISVRNLYDFIR